MGVVSASVSMPAISGRPLAMAAWTEGSDREARWASWLAQASVIHRGRHLADQSVHWRQLLCCSGFSQEGSEGALLSGSELALVR